jgi:hypothetical protein
MHNTEKSLNGKDSTNQTTSTGRHTVKSKVSKGEAKIQEIIDEIGLVMELNRERKKEQRLKNFALSFILEKGFLDEYNAYYEKNKGKNAQNLCLTNLMEYA